MKLKTFLIGTILISQNLYSQGCSDAGFCTVGSDHPIGDSIDLKKYRLSINSSNGIGDDAVFVSTNSLIFDYAPNDKWSINSKLTTNIASGRLATVIGLGDFYLTGFYKFGEKWKKAIMLGTKIPLSNANSVSENLSLPMQYQSSLGTLDLLTSFRISNERWHFSTAFQSPLINLNKNTFFQSKWDSSEVVNYASSNKFERKSDVLLRFKYTFIKSEKLKINAGLLAIYHLQADQYTDEFGTKKTIEGSEGLTLNITSEVDFKLSSRFSLSLAVGAPIVVRKVRPDGLTRAFAIAPELIYRF